MFSFRLFYFYLVTLPYDVCIVCLPVGVQLLVERYKFFEERVTLGVGASGAVERKRAEAQMQLAHPLEDREIFNVFRLDVVGQCVVVGTFAFWLLVCFGCERYVLGHDSLDLLLHFLDLRTGEVGDAEVVILLKLVVHEVVAAVNLRDYVVVHNLIARQLQKVECADGIVALRFRRFEPLLDLFGKFVVHYALAFGCHKISQAIIAAKRRKMRNFAIKARLRNEKIYSTFLYIGRFNIGLCKY